jgi:hypothetical protein
MAVFLDLFAGAGSVGKKMAGLGYYVLPWDVNGGSNYDLTAKRNQSNFFGWIRGGLVAAAFSAFECKTFSRARDRPNGPPQLRSNKFPLGVPNLSPGDNLKVQAGNSMLRFTVTMLLICRRFFIPAGAENPLTSRAWIVKSMLGLERLVRVSTAVTHFCQWGKPWQKATKLIGVCVDFQSIDAIRCRPHGNICSRSLCAHQVLAGKNADGTFWTHVAQPYPRKFAAAIALCLDSSRLSLLAARFSALCY